MPTTEVLKDKIIKQLKTINLWHLVWISVIGSVIFTLIIVSLMSVIFHGYVTFDYLITGMTAAFFVSLVVISILIYLVQQLRSRDKSLEKKTIELEELNAELEDRIKDEVEKSREKELLVFEQIRQIGISELLINIAHHWRQPLNAIGVLVQDIEEGYNYGELSGESLRNNVELIMAELLELSDTITTFNEMYRSAKETVSFQPSEIIEKALAFLDVRFKNDSIKTAITLQDDFWISGNPNGLSQALVKLLTNSVEIFHERKTENREIAINLCEDRATGKAVINVSDNGGGIDDTVLNRVFDPYFTTKYKARDKGLGLYLVKVIIENEMHGTLNVKNTGKGVTFTIEV